MQRRTKIAKPFHGVTTYFGGDAMTFIKQPMALPFSIRRA